MYIAIKVDVIWLNFIRFLFFDVRFSRCPFCDINFTLVGVPFVCNFTVTYKYDQMSLACLKNN